MIWETQKIMKLIDTKKWNKLNKKQQKNILMNLQLWIAINYMIHLNLTGLSLKKQLKLLINYYNTEPHAFYPLKLPNVIELFFRVQPLIPLFLYVNYIMEPNQRLSRKKTKSNKKTQKNTNNKIQKEQQPIIKKQSGGYLFMLTSRGEEPIRGVDMENFLAKMDTAVQDISYLPTAAATEEGQPSHPYNGFALLYYLARNQPSSAGFFAMPYAGEYLNLFKGNPMGTKYSTVLRLWTDLQKEAKLAEKRTSAKEKFVEDYEKFTREYVGNKEFDEKKEEYKKYLEDIEEYKKKTEIEKQLLEAYEKKNPYNDTKDKKILNQAGKLDYLTMGIGMAGIGQ